MEREERFSFIARVPDEPGALHRVAAIITEFGLNITRTQYDQRIDRETVFFEVIGDAGQYRQVLDHLNLAGLLQTSLPKIRILKLYVYLPHQAGALSSFLDLVRQGGANIFFIDFDERGRHPERVTISLNLDQNGVVDDLLGQLSSAYKLEVVEYDPTGHHLDDTIFYVRFAQRVRELIGDGADDSFLLQFLHDINHTVQELMNRGRDPQEVFANVLSAGQTLHKTSKEGFYSDIQQIQVSDLVTLFCFQMPCGGNVFLFKTGDELVLVDTGFGIYHDDIVQMLARYGFTDLSKLTRIIITHADADHCGGSGLFPVPCYMHPGTLEVIRQANRAYGSRSEGSVLEEVYTTMINLFSRFAIPEDVHLFSSEPQGMVGPFPIVGEVTIGDLQFLVLEGLGGHMYAQTYLFCREAGLFFAADCVINFDSLTQARRDYSTLAVLLVTSVNVDSDLARTERKAVVQILNDLNHTRGQEERPCLICGGHGAVSVLDHGRLVPYGTVTHYAAKE
ncbi:MBL fold metallo-hydrolase [Methanosphaerula palustris]|uniref:Beta-lactamase domain protein n=1 Tax=Methanosphaerula palustris (strain ATCC BAA-1556 / DSM 19958 / E1-9c) TaxID=521011 RepID=B8GGN3_METPE|nr:MBL fold metallo-hydrolase [Methanosphaerula palustris]ACL16288.1 beta-lactamase domain protein [Methanosphaerula palustris E1-9c]